MGQSVAIGCNTKPHETQATFCPDGRRISCDDRSGIQEIHIRMCSFSHARYDGEREGVSLRWWTLKRIGKNSCPDNAASTLPHVTHTRCCVLCSPICPNRSKRSGWNVISYSLPRIFISHLGCFSITHISVNVSG